MVSFFEGVGGEERRGEEDFEGSFLPFFDRLMFTDEKNIFYFFVIFVRCLVPYLRRLRRRPVGIGFYGMFGSRGLTQQNKRMANG